MLGWVCFIVFLVFIASLVFVKVRAHAMQRDEELRKQAARAEYEHALSREKGEILTKYAARLRAITGTSVITSHGDLRVEYHFDADTTEKKIDAIRAAKSGLVVILEELIADRTELSSPYSDALSRAYPAQQEELKQELGNRLLPYAIVRNAIQQLDTKLDVDLAVTQTKIVKEKLAPAPDPNEDIPAKISKLAQLFYAGILTEEEFEEKKDELLARM